MCVKNLASIEHAASIDYLCIQSIGILDDESKILKYKASIKLLQDMGIKVILATGIKVKDARKIALRTGILEKKTEKICGALIEGSDLRKICSGRDPKFGFTITPEYLSVVCRATQNDRSMLIDYLSNLHPARICDNSPYGFGSELIKYSLPVASVGAVGSGDNDVKML